MVDLLNILKQHKEKNNLDPEAIRRQTQSILQGLTGKINSKDNKADELRQRYLDAKNNIIDGPERYNDAEKNYFKFINGENWWNNYKKEKMNKKIKNRLDSDDKKFLKKYKSINKNILYYKSQYENSNNMNDLISDVNEKISTFGKKSYEKEKQVQTSYRKSTYYQQDIKDMESFISTITILYRILVIALAVASLFIFGHLKDAKTWALIVGLVIYPFIIVKIHLFINKIFKSVFINFKDLDKKIISA